MVEFEKYEREKMISGYPSVRITQKSIVFNASAYAEFLEGYKFCEFFFAKDEKIIGIKLLEKSTKDAFPIRVYRKQQSPIVNLSCKRFLDYYKIPEYLKKTVTLPLEKDEKSGMLLVKLKEK